jgi:pimeloyl-ACP methyl ester carboxylesterase/tellurite resistance protein
MNNSDMQSPNITSVWDAVGHLVEYTTDTMQRSILYADTMRRRGNTYIEHLKNGQPPVLVFKYEMILDGREFKKPVNYSLVRITDRRAKKRSPEEKETDRIKELRGKTEELPKRPIVIIDPRAGHGPGIGGSKRNSEIGMALERGYPVYFILFYAEPMPGQTLSDIEAAEARFIEEIVALHPYADAPAIMGNCQAGWAAALLCADRPDITGPLILNGAPLSYWAGIEGTNPMRYKGGLSGGSWVVSLLSDIGNGKFDGANLVSGFEDLNPANTIWTKQYNVYKNIDEEVERYLSFEKWWGGFFLMNAEEIEFIVSNLFVGNKLEKGELEIRPGTKINLRNIESPIIVFASRGDNITPPQQALNWIPKVHPTTDSIKKAGQVIIYIIHEDIGHLGIFVSGGVAQKEHKEIIASFDMIDYLPPGLYEMIIEGDIKTGDIDTRFEERTIDDILDMDDGVQDEENFSTVNRMSELLDNHYKLYCRPWVQSMSSELTGEISRLLHPLRLKRYLLSDINPFLRPLKYAASSVKANRKPVKADNPFLALEYSFSDFMIKWLNQYRDARDGHIERKFRAIYDNPLMQFFCMPVPDREENGAIPEAVDGESEDKRWAALEEGGVAAGLIRIMMAVARKNHIIKRRLFEVAQEIASTHKVLSKIRPAQFKKIVRLQAQILQADEDTALKALGKLIKTKEDRAEALSIAKRIALADGMYEDEEKKVVDKIQRGLEIKDSRQAVKENV